MSLFKRVFLLQIAIFSLLFSEETFESLSIKLFVDDQSKRAVESRPFNGGTINLHNSIEREPIYGDRGTKSNLSRAKYSSGQQQKLKEAFFSPLHSIEFGLKYRPLLYSKYQSEIFSDNHQIEFYSSWDLSFAPYLLLKSKAFRFETLNNLGWFFKHSFDYYSFSEQRGVYSSGEVDSENIDIGTELSMYSWSFLPTLFFYQDLQRQNSGVVNRFVFELSGGVGLTLLDGSYRILNYPSQTEFDNNPENYQLLGNRPALLSEVGSYSFDIAMHLIYNITLKYIYDHYTLHLSLENPFIFKDNYWNTTLFSIGIGYSF